MPEPTYTHHDGNPEMGAGTKAFVKALGAFFIALKYLIVVVFIAAFFQGVFYVREYEEAMLFHFGKLVLKGPDQDPILTSGKLYWAWPYPIDEVRRIPARRPVTLTTTHFWPREDPNRVDPGSAQVAADIGTGIAPGQGGYALTGDTNIVHMNWSVVYTVTDARSYYLDFFEGSIARTDYEGNVTTTDEKTVETLILNCLESAVLKEVASWSVDDVLDKARSMGGSADEPAHRQLLTAAVKTRLERLLQQLGVGVSVDHLTMNTRPPDSVLSSFREVNDAANEYRTALEEARSYEQRVIAEAEGRASEIVAEATSYKTKVVASVEADAEYFEAVLKEYRKNPRTMLTALYADTIRDVLGQVKERYVIHGNGDDKEVRVMINPEPEQPPEVDEGEGD